MNVALILVSLGIATGPEPVSHPLVVAYFEDMDACVGAANQAKLPVAGIPGRSLNTWAQFVCVPTPSGMAHRP
jgi:hypothetical protein